VSNQQYRVNSDWDSIVNGIAAFGAVNNVTYKTWAAIGFKFNEHNIVNMKQLAIALGFDQFQLTKSTKFGSKYPDAYGKNDHLEPDNKNLISQDFRFSRNIELLSTKKNPDGEIKKIFLQRANDLKNTEYSAICFIGNKGVFLNSQGEFYPCCWTANRYDHNKDWQGKFNLHHRSFEGIINDPFWTIEFLKFNNLECKTKCTKKKLDDEQHTTEWWKILEIKPLKLMKIIPNNLIKQHSIILIPIQL
jgi:MoaA/NifB/PqqE/SkfB family radical SAM enzyme